MKDIDYQNAAAILTKYNTRINPREHGVSSDTIFTEILTVWKKELCNLSGVKKAFYSYFRNDVILFSDTKEILKLLKKWGIFTATLSDGPYGMDNEYVWKNIEQVIPYIDLPFISNDTGWRKPGTKGLILINAILLNL